MYAEVSRSSSPSTSSNLWVAIGHASQEAVVFHEVLQLIIQASKGGFVAAEASMLVVTQI